MDDDSLKLLGRFVMARRLSLGIELSKDLAARMGVTPRVMSDIERGNRRVGDQTYRKLEAALKWATGSATDVLDRGAEPTPLEARADVQWPRSSSSPSVAELSAEPEIQAFLEQLAQLLERMPAYKRRETMDALLDETFRTLSESQPYSARRLLADWAVEAAGPDVSVDEFYEFVTKLRAKKANGGDGHAEADARGPASTSQDKYELIAHDEEHSIEDEQGHDETP